MKTATLYTLSDPRTGEVRYVGWTTCRPSHRLSGHLCEASRRNRTNHKDNWIRALLAEGLRPLLRMVAVCDEGEGAVAEIDLIASLKRLGYRLVNSTDGGEGTTNPPPEVRAKIATASRQRMADPEVRARLAAATSAAQRGRPKSQITRERMSIAARNRSPETLAKMAAAGRGRHPSDETREKIAAAHRGKPNHFRGKQHSAEARAKMSDAQRKRWALIRKSRAILT